MVKSSSAAQHRTKVGFFRQHQRQLVASFQQLAQRPLGNILTLAVIAIALALPTNLYLLSKNLLLATENIATPSQISLYFSDAVPEARIMVLKDDLERRIDVQSVDYISAQQGLAQLSQQAGFDEVIEILEENALPAVLIVSPAMADTQTILELKDTLRQLPDVSQLRVDEDWLTRLDALRYLAGLIASSLSCLMLVSVVLIVGNTLRFSIQENKGSIQTMKLIGATDHYITRPYLYTGMWFGLLGAFCAWLMTLMVSWLLYGAVNDLAVLYDSHFQLTGLVWDEVGLLLLLGVLLGFIAAKLATRRHLKEIEPLD